ncbi:MAG: hypothetical protein ACYC0F_02235 [Rhodanobacter sp.]
MNGSQEKSIDREDDARKAPQKLNAKIARRFKQAAKRSQYSWLPWVCGALLVIAYIVMLHYPNGKTFDIFCNLTVMGGVLLIASGSVLTKDVRNHFFDIKNFDKNRKDKNGKPLQRPTLDDSQVAALFLEASDKCEAGTLTVIAGSAALVLHLIIDLVVMMLK